MKMMRLLLAVFFLLILSCNGKINNTNPTKEFNSFEISYSDGWLNNYTLLVDSNKKYIYSNNIKSYYSGTISDTIFSLIGQTFNRIRNDSTFITSYHDCYDCDAVAIKIVTYTDTTRILQTENINSSIIPLINVLKSFKVDDSIEMTKSYIHFESRNILVPPPPPIDDTLGKNKTKTYNGVL